MHRWPLIRHARYLTHAVRLAGWAPVLAWRHGTVLTRAELDALQAIWDGKA